MSITISALRSDHSEYTTEGNVSNHYFGRAMDIAAALARAHREVLYTYTTIGSASGAGGAGSTRRSAVRGAGRSDFLRPNKGISTP